MKKWLVCIGLVLPMLLVLEAGAVTAKLEMQPIPRVARSGDPASQMARMVSAQTVRATWQNDGVPETPAEFSARVKKEPEYRCKTPLRGVLELAGTPYLFVFDATDAVEGGYDRLYFDRNGNGDLTDDGMALRNEDESRVNRRTAVNPRLMPRATTAAPSAGGTTVARAAAPVRTLFGSAWPRAAAQSAFDGVAVHLTVEGTPLDYTLLPQVSCSQTDRGESKTTSVYAMFRSGQMARGTIELDGKSCQVFLVDSNSNGRFDDAVSFTPYPSGNDERVRPAYGDSLVLAADNGNMPRVVRTLQEGVHVAPLYVFDGKRYQLTVAPAGSSITLEPWKSGTGTVEFPDTGYTAVLYGDAGFVPVSSDEGKSVEVPAGQWRLYTYTLDKTPADALNASREPRTRVPYTRVAATGSSRCEAINVEKGKTVRAPFGPPYATEVTASPTVRPPTAQLSLALFGKAGEAVTSLYVDGQRPDAPSFVVAGADGRKVESGAFQFG